MENNCDILEKVDASTAFNGFVGTQKTTIVERIGPIGLGIHTNLKPCTNAVK